MLNLKNKQIKYTKLEKDYIKGLDLDSGNSWKIQTKEMKSLKYRIKDWLTAKQNDRCAYCSSRLNVGGRAEIEHIAPKGELLYPKFTFNENNLILACQHCNSSTKKGAKDPIVKYSVYYKRCKFSIVHPYFDDPDEHYKWINEIRICIVANPDSIKAKNSIEMFELDGPYLTEERAKTFLWEKMKQGANLSSADQAEIQKALEFSP
ncbi:retron system putative HNH endonuclease [Bacillus tropicus]|uniref:TIGR02646 family protein n=1 Tax=Bacillus wiedmannii TaxID=1890302 RepID=A0A242Z0P4_9BACI|nr:MULTISPECIES: retron system putative HNH endonuclease [Bacillus cereus group]MED3126822.1 TIGR02646 family protein [Bacillus wiedmannii]OTX86029.1 TIGR02646 family protein [Bacillus wiedmannii]UOK49052.1 TIGR02646 family protein [Bacillus tropicus]